MTMGMNSGKVPSLTIKPHFRNKQIRQRTWNETLLQAKPRTHIRYKPETSGKKRPKEWKLEFEENLAQQDYTGKQSFSNHLETLITQLWAQIKSPTNAPRLVNKLVNTTSQITGGKLSIYSEIFQNFNERF